MRIEPANISQLNDIHSLISESITHLCKKDHLNDPDNLEFWLGNRTQDWLRETIFEPGSQGFVCLENPRSKAFRISKVMAFSLYAMSIQIIPARGSELLSFPLSKIRQANGDSKKLH